MRKNMIQRFAIGTALILLLPLIAMRFTEEVLWGFFDFVFIGCLLMGTGLIYTYGVRSVKNDAKRRALTAILFAAMLLIWVEAAVGIFN